MDALKSMELAGIIPVVVLEDAANAVPLAKALLKGGLGVMEITMRTKAGLESIKKVAAECEDMLVGAGTVTSLDQCKACVDAGAQFIVCPGFDYELVKWCVDNGVCVTPGCVTPTEITQALGLGVSVLKFFPANVYGGISAMKSLTGPFGSVKFVPTGGVTKENIGEYAKEPFVFAVGGSFVCSKEDISKQRFDKITETVRATLQSLMGFELRHVGINCADAAQAEKTAQMFAALFNFEYKPGNSSIFAGAGIEVMKEPYIGDNGHIAIGTNHVERAAAYLARLGAKINWESAKYKGDRCAAVYLEDLIGGFGVHLVQK